MVELSTYYCKIEGLIPGASGSRREKITNEINLGHQLKTNFLCFQWWQSGELWTRHSEVDRSIPATSGVRLERVVKNSPHGNH